MGWNPFKKSSWKQVGDAIVDTGKKAGDAIVNAGTTVVNGATDAYNTTKNFAESLARDTNILDKVLMSHLMPGNRALPK